MDDLWEKKQKAHSLRKDGKYKEASLLFIECWNKEKDEFTGAGLISCLKKLNRLDEAVKIANDLITLPLTIDWAKNEIIWAFIRKPIKETEDLEVVLQYAEKIEKLKEFEKDDLAVKKIAFRISKLISDDDDNEKWEISLRWLSKIAPNSLSEEKIMGHWSDKATWNYRMLKALLKTGKYSEVLTKIDEKIREFPKIKEFKTIKADLLFNDENYEQSAQIYEDIMLYEKDSWVLSRYAEVLLKLGKKESALHHLFQACDLNNQLASMVNIYERTGDLCFELGHKEEAYYHFILRKLVRKEEGWRISDTLEKKIRDLREILPNLLQIESIAQALSQCRKIWEKSQTSQLKKFEGVVHLGKKNQPYCFIHSGYESIYCRKSRLPNGIKDQDNVECWVKPSFDKKKNRKSWEAVKVRRI